MTEIFDINRIQLILIFIIPGFVSYKVWSLLIPSKDIAIKDYIIEIICYSFINFALLFWLINIAENIQGLLQSLLYLIILFIAPIIWPLIWIKIVKSKRLKGKIVYPTPKAWDFFFGLGKPCFMLIHLHTGKMIGGLYYLDSYSSSYPQQKDLYLKEVWNITEKGEFLNKIEATEGLLISYDVIEYIELFNPYPDNKEKNNG
jgi:vacuolar-type H+-ATPase subunit I/STV1